MVKDIMMKKEMLKKVLEQEKEKYESKTYEELANLEDPLAYERETKYGKCQIEIQKLEKNKDFIRISISVDDGGLRAFMPLSTNFLIYREN